MSDQAQQTTVDPPVVPPPADVAVAAAGPVDAIPHEVDLEGAPPAPTDAAPTLQHFKDEDRAGIVENFRKRREALRSDPSLAELGDAIAATAAQPTPDSPQNSTPAPATVSAPASPVTAPAPTDAPLFTRVKINGMHLEVPSAEVNAAGGVTAYESLKTAEVQLRQTRAIEASLRAREPAPATAPAPAQPTPAAPSTTDRKKLGEDVLNAVLENDPAKLAEALTKVGVAPPAQATPAPAARAPALARDPVLGTRTKAEALAANAVFDAEFSDLKANPGAFSIAQEQILARMKDPRYEHVPLEMVVRDIGAKLRGMTGTRAAPPAAPVTDQLRDRQIAKTRLPIASNAGTRVAPAPAPTPTQTQGSRRSSYIATLNARNGSNSSIAERRAATQR